MNRFFASLVDNEVILSKESEHHLKDVLRIKENEIIQLAIAEKVFNAKVLSLSPLKISLLEEVAENRESKINCLIAFALLKGGHDDLVIQKGTELGVSSFFPLLTDRTIIQLPKEKDKEKRKERFLKIAMGASEQCKRTIAPTIHDITDFKEILKLDATYKFLAYEGEAGKSNSLFSYLKDFKENDSVLVAIGPEGGWSEKEVQLALDNGFKLLSLGKRILRAETSSIYCASLINAIGDTL